MTILVYLFRGRVLIPTTARTEAGFLLSVEPVETINTVGPDTLQQSLERVTAQGNPSLPTPPVGKTVPKSVILKYAGVRSWTEFENDAQLWIIDLKGQGFEIIPNRWRPDRGFEEDSSRKVVIPSSCGVEGLANRMAEIIAEEMARESET